MPSIEDPGAVITAILSAAPPPLKRCLLLVQMQVFGCWPGTYIRPGTGVREDLYLTGDDLGLGGDYLATVPILNRALRVCRQHTPDAVAVIIIDDPRPGRPVPRPTHYELITVLGQRLGEHDTQLLDAWVVTGTEPGSRWTSLLDKDTGVLADYTTTDPTEVGEPVRLVEPVPAVLEPGPALTEQVARCLRERGVVLTSEAPYVPDDSAAAVACRRDRLRFALTQIHAAGSGATLSAASLAELAIALEDIEIRDCLYALSTGPRGGACMAAWTQLVRALPAPGRTQAAMMLAVTAYTDDDAALATAAIQVALTDEPGQQTALTLTAAFACSVNPDLIRASMRGGYTIAAELGIDLD
ncbi:DUF4192 domain-containing protein [Nocardia vinacea]|uniref:DUF4192 domain-containing protein n=1 Tax=Nocardia vinacea TaxID=96468 RepID=UPI002E14C3A6|nr:DUF4192 domain-containing protein [Nocardia vinacea]